MQIFTLLNNKIAFQYICENITEVVRNIADTYSAAVPHYVSYFSGNNEKSNIYLPSYRLHSDRANKTTVVYATSAHKPEKIIFTSPLLDLDYSKPYVVINKIKLLTTFS
jgi:hypothetical protein